MARPMPAVEAVTSAVRPLSSIFMAESGAGIAQYPRGRVIGCSARRNAPLHTAQ
jgi:hypothetical protein